MALILKSDRFNLVLHSKKNKSIEQAVAVQIVDRFKEQKMKALGKIFTIQVARHFNVNK